MAGLSSLGSELPRDARQAYRAENIPAAKGEYPFTCSRLDAPAGEWNSAKAEIPAGNKAQEARREVCLGDATLGYHPHVTESQAAPSKRGRRAKRR